MQSLVSLFLTSSFAFLFFLLLYLIPVDSLLFFCCIFFFFFKYPLQAKEMFWPHHNHRLTKPLIQVLRAISLSVMFLLTTVQAGHLVKIWVQTALTAILITHVLTGKSLRSLVRPNKGSIAQWGQFHLSFLCCVYFFLFLFSFSFFILMCLKLN